MAGEAVLRALETAVRALEAARVPYVLIGGAALPAWGRMRATADSDLLIALDVHSPSGERTLASAVEALRGAGLAHMERADRRRIGDKEVLHFWFPMREQGMSVRVDLIVSPGPEDRGVIERAVLRKVDGLTVRVASCEDLILLKLASGRPVDVADAQDLLAINRGELDVAALERRAAERELKREVEELLERAKDA